MNTQCCDHCWAADYGMCADPTCSCHDASDGMSTGWMPVGQTEANVRAALDLIKDLTPVVALYLED